MGVHVLARTMTDACNRLAGPSRGWAADVAECSAQRLSASVDERPMAQPLGDNCRASSRDAVRIHLCPSPNFRLKRVAYCMLKQVNWLIFDLPMLGDLVRGRDSERSIVCVDVSFVVRGVSWLCITFRSRTESSD